MKITQNGKVAEGKLVITDETSSSKLRLVIQSEDNVIVIELSKAEFDFLKSEVNDR